MRRKDREITDFDEIIKIIDECDIVRLGLSDGNFPYIVPVNFAYEITENKQLYLYIHGAMAGRKFEMLTKNPFCSFEMDIPLQIDCIADKKDITMRYKSVMGKAEAFFLKNSEKQSAIENIILARYEQTRKFDYNKGSLERTAVIKLKITEITAKANLTKN